MYLLCLLKFVQFYVPYQKCHCLGVSLLIIYAGSGPLGGEWIKINHM